MTLNLDSRDAEEAFLQYHAEITEADDNYDKRPADLAIDAAIESRRARIISARQSLVSRLTA